MGDVARRLDPPVNEERQQGAGVEGAAEAGEGDSSREHGDFDQIS